MKETEATNSVGGEALPPAPTNFDPQQNEGIAADTNETEVHGEPALGHDSEPVEVEEGLDEEQYEEIDRNGRKATIPAWLKPELMMQADYTRKTQELADARRVFETERKTVQQMTHAELSAHANLNSINREIEQLSKVDWSAWQDSDPSTAQRAFGRFQLLQNAQAETLGYLDSLREERASMAQQEAAKRYEEGAAELTRDVKDWSPELAAKLFDFGQRHYGFSAEDLLDTDNPRAIKALHAAYQWEEHQARQRQAERHAAAQGVRPAARVGGAAPKSGLDDRLSAEEWLRRRNSQLRKRA